MASGNAAISVTHAAERLGRALAFLSALLLMGAEHDAMHDATQDAAAPLRALSAFPGAEAEIVRLVQAGRVAESLPFAQAILGQVETRFGRGNVVLTLFLSELGDLYRERKVFDVAEALYLDALRIWQKETGRESEATIGGWGQLGRLYLEEKKFEKAKQSYQEALALAERNLGAEHLTTADAAFNVGTAHWELGEIKEAEPRYKQSLAIREKRLGEEHPDTAAALQCLGQVYATLRNYGRARSVYQRALGIRERTRGPEHPETAQSLDKLAEVERLLGQGEEAEARCRRALRIREKVFGPEHLETATSLINLAQFRKAAGSYREAESLCRHGVAIRQKELGDESLDFAAGLSILGSILDDEGAYEEAMKVLRQAVAILESTDTTGGMNLLPAYGNLAVLCRKTGLNEEAGRLYGRGVDLVEAMLGPDHPEMVIPLGNLAELDGELGRYGEAETLYLRALSISGTRKDVPAEDVASIKVNLGNLYVRIGALDKAEGYLREGWATFTQTLGSRHAKTAVALNSLALLYSHRGNRVLALMLSEQVLKSLVDALGAEHPQVAVALGNVCVNHAFLGNRAAAESMCRRAAELNEKALGPEHVNTAASLNNLAGALSANDPERERLLRRAVAILERSEGPEGVLAVEARSNLAAVCWRRGALTEAVQLLKTNARVNESVARRVLVRGEESRKRAFMETMMIESDAIVSLSLAARDRVPEVASVAFGVVMQRKGRVLDVLTDTFGALRASLSEASQGLLDQWMDANARYATLFYRGRGDEAVEAYGKLLASARSEADMLEARLGEASTEFRSSTITATVEMVQGPIPADGVLVEWFRFEPVGFDGVGELSWGEPRYAAFVVKQKGPPVVVDLGEASQVERGVRRLLGGLRNPGSLFVAAEARRLWERLMAPLEPHLVGARRLIVSPDGELNLLPFGVLVDDGGRYLIERYEITYATSARDLLRTVGQARSRQGAVVVADPDYGSVGPIEAAVGLEMPNHSASAWQGLRGFQRLSGTAGEALALKEMLGLRDAQVLTGAAATEGALKRLKGPRLLHVATHGFFLPGEGAGRQRPSWLFLSGDPGGAPRGENPLLLSGLALAGANELRRGVDDGILTALEVGGLDLRGTDLVVLSACETGIGEVQRGEGVLGLRRALVLAGARNQVASLWKVSDAATRDLMVDFYRRLTAGADASAALRDAQLVMLTHPSRQRVHPYYWGSFVVIGQGGPVDVRSP
jgi:CHAT domain-containing protein/tetratricopeptide (TPR) repeat protein